MLPNWHIPIWPGRLLLTVLVVLGFAVILIPIPGRYHRSEERRYRVQASSYEYSPAVIRAEPGDKVTIELVSTDVVHGLYIDGYDLSIQADPGQPQSLTFTADKEGSFRMRCSVTCGPLHPFMIGKLEVGSNPYLWRGVGLFLVASLIVLVFYRYEAYRTDSQRII